MSTFDVFFTRSCRVNNHAANALIIVVESRPGLPVISYLTLYRRHSSEDNAKRSMSIDRL